MNGCLFICRSATYAQKMKNALLQAGIEAKIVRPNLRLTDGECGYAVKISDVFLAEALEILKRKRIEPMRILVSDANQQYREMKQ